MELIEAIEQWAWIGWLVLILVFLVIEMLTLGFTFLMLAIGGIAGLIADLLGAPIWLQVIIAAVVAAVLILVLRPPLLKRLRRCPACTRRARGHRCCDPRGRCRAGRTG